MEGEDYGIIEGCGGVYGLEQIDKAYKKGSGSEYEHYVEWLSEETLNLSEFDIEEMNRKLKKYPKAFKRTYEDWE